MNLISRNTFALRAMTAAVILALVIVFIPAMPATAQQAETFADRLAINRYQIDVKDGRLSGAGATVLESALADAQFVLVGEDHGMAQVPQFDAAICALIGPAGFHNLAIEVGPTAAGELDKWVAAGDGASQLAAFEKEYPETIAFYDWSEEYEMLAQCSSAATGGKFHIWGLDQELMGASRILLTRILEQHPGPEATEEAQRLLQKNDDARTKAAKSGNPGELFMLGASDEELARFKELLGHEGNATSQGLLAALIESRQIYQNNMNGNAFDSNRQRSLLMKSNFIREYGKASETEGKPPKVMLKFGGWHLFKGINPLHNNDLGNFVTELADYNRSKSVHISHPGDEREATALRRSWATHAGRGVQPGRRQRLGFSLPQASVRQSRERWINHVRSARISQTLQLAGDGRQGNGTPYLRLRFPGRYPERSGVEVDSIAEYRHTNLTLWVR